MVTLGTYVMPDTISGLLVLVAGLVVLWIIVSIPVYVAGKLITVGRGGFGDAMAAAYTWAMERNNDFRDALRWGVAAGTASAKLPGMRFANLEQTREIYKLVEVRHVD